MALITPELYEGPTNQPAKKRILSMHSQPKSFAAGSGTLAAGTPCGVILSTGFWDDWASGTSEISVLTADATPASAGTFTLTYNGHTTAPIAFDAAAAAIVTALEALENVSPGDVTGVDTVATDLGDANHVVTLTWVDRADVGDVILASDQVLISAGNDFVLSTSQAGVDGVEVKGIVWPDAVVLNAGGEVTGMVMLKGKAHIDDLVLPVGETLATLKAELKTKARPLGLEIEGYEGIS